MIRCEFDDICTDEGTRLFGDLFVCPDHYREFSRTMRNPRCQVCGYWQETPGPCGEPCV